jgi:hypothetical protein
VPADPGSDAKEKAMVSWKETAMARLAGVLGAILVVSAAASADALAQLAQGPAGPEGTITAAGTATFERRPDLVRMQIDLSADGKDAKEALANLRQQEKAAREKLAKLGAADASIKLEDPRVATPGPNDQRMQMERMIRARTGVGGNKPPATGPSQPKVSVAGTLRAEWRLAAQSADDLLVETNDIQAKVKAANLVAPKATRTPEEQEEAEEAAGTMVNNGQPNPGEPVYIFVCKLSEEDRAKVTADAFGRAKEEAGRLAKAAGTSLGGLRQLTSGAGPAADAEQFGGMDYSNPYGRYFYNMMQRQQGGVSAAEAPEAIGAQPGKVSYRVMVSASFAVK